MSIEGCRHQFKLKVTLIGPALLSVFLFSAIAESGIKKSSTYDPLFPKPKIVMKQVLFWQQIFKRFPSTTTLIHDSHNPSNIIDIIDHKLLAQKKPGKSISGFRKRAKLNSLYLKRYVLALKRFSRIGKNAVRFGGIEKRIYSVYSKNPSELIRLYKGRVTLRSQTGLSDEFIRAAERAQDYLPYIERVFNSRGVPMKISRLAFVESMFNINARSKVGASGIWQFMPATAKMYMTVNRYVDERNSPFKASKGAARLLADNYKALKSWPLAITAYNHGRGGMRKASRMAGSKDLGLIIKNYKSRTFGFASRNFYSEFLAAAHVYDQLLEEGLAKRRPSKLNLTPITLKKQMSVFQILNYTALTSYHLKKHNPGIKKSSYGRGKYRLLPKSFELFVPTNIVRKVQLALVKIISGRKIASQSNNRKKKSRR